MHGKFRLHSFFGLSSRNLARWLPTNRHKHDAKRGASLQKFTWNQNKKQKQSGLKWWWIGSADTRIVSAVSL